MQKIIKAFLSHGHITNTGTTQGDPVVSSTAFGPLSSQIDQLMQQMSSNNQGS